MTAYLDPFAFDKHRAPWVENSKDFDLEYFLTTVGPWQMSPWEQFRFMTARRQANQGHTANEGEAA